MEPKTANLHPWEKPGSRPRTFFPLMGGVRRRRYRFIMNRSTLSFSACLVNELLEEKKKRKQNEVAVRYYPLTYSSLMLSIIYTIDSLSIYTWSWLVLRATIFHKIGARHHECPIAGIRLQPFVTGYLRHSHVNYAHLNGFLHNVFYSVSNLSH